MSSAPVQAPVQTPALSVSGLTLDEARSLMECLTTHIAILDGGGTILAVNRAWQAFAAAHGADPARVGAGVDYLAICEAAASQGEDSAARFRDGLQLVLGGQLDTFQIDSDHVVPGGRLVLRTRATRLVDPAGTYVMVTHAAHLFDREQAA